MCDRIGNGSKLTQRIIILVCHLDSQLVAFIFKSTPRRSLLIATINNKLHTGMFQTKPPSTNLMASVRLQAAEFLCVKLDQCVLMPSTTVSFK